MQISKIKIRNILGLEQLEIQPGKITVLSGRNATGKSSVFAAIRAGLGGGHDAELIHKGADEAEVVLVLDDGTDITKRITPERATLAVDAAEVGRLSKGQTYLDRLTDAMAINPIDFLTAPPERRIKTLLEAIPLRVTTQQLEDACGRSTNIGKNEHALIAIGTLEKSLYDERTSANRDAKAKGATAEQLRAGIPTKYVGPDVISEEARNLLNELKEITDQHSKLVTEAEEDFQKATALAQQDYDDATEAIHKVKENELAALNRKYDERFATARVRLDAGKAKARNDYTQRREIVEKAVYPRRDEINALVAGLKEQREAALSFHKTLEVAGKLEAEMIQLRSESEGLTVALANLAELRCNLTKDLPISGLEIRDGKLYRDGIPFDKLNESQRICIALEVAALRAGKLGIVCCDGLERLDAESFRAFIEEAKQTDLQFILSRVTDDAELKVKVEK